MKKIILFVLLVYKCTFADYSTPGTGKSWNLDSLVAYSSGVVTYSGGVYLVNDTLTISASDTIKILNDATLKLSSLVLINISGTLTINPPDSVKITAQDTAQQFLGMRFDTLSRASVLRKMIFEYGNAIKLVSTSILIDSCTIRYNTLVSNFSSGAINLFRSNPIISNNKIFHNRRSAIISGANVPSSPQIIGNTIYENNVFNENYPQINLGASGTDTLIIRNNIIRGYYDMAGGIALFPIGSIQNCVIENNIIKHNRYGIVFQNVNINAYVVNNIIDSNNINPDAMSGGSGINLYGNSSINVIISRNKLRWNLWGVTIQSTAKPNLGDLNNPDTSAHGWNYIYGNSHNDTTFDLYNNTPDSIKAENNFWGTGNLDTIELHIFHKPDNPVLGFVDYLPIYIPIGIIRKSNILPQYFKLYDAYPNPFNPETKIKFDIPGSSISLGVQLKVRLIIYDILGRELVTLINQQLKPGSYEINWDATNYPSSVYLCRLTAGSFSQAKKLVLVK
jgi:hypothetical protein